METRHGSRALKMLVVRVLLRYISRTGCRNNGLQNCDVSLQYRRVSWL